MPAAKPIIPDIETWLPVVNYEGFYEVSDHGRVRRLETYVVSPRSRSKHRIVRERVLKPQAPRGYLTLNLCKCGVAKNHRVHRLVMAAFAGVCPEGITVNHRDGCKANNRRDNLEYVTMSVNNKHAYDVCGKGATIPRGVTQHQAKLTEANVRAIRSQLARGDKSVDIAARFHICRASVMKIAKRETWRHVM